MARCLKSKDTVINKNKNYYKLMMKENSGRLIQSDTVLEEAADFEPSQLPETNEETKEGIACSRWFSLLIRKVSFGQYRTPLYYKK
jgi:hypothetical protein